MTTKAVRIPIELYNLAEEEGKKLHMPASVAIRYFIQNGINRGVNTAQKQPEKPKIDGDLILKGAQTAAILGTESLNNYMRTLTVHEEQAIKYDIKKLKENAKYADKQFELATLPAVKKELDRVCMDGKVIFETYFANLSKVIRDELKPMYKEWWRDSGYSDSVLKIRGSRPTERRSMALWARDVGHTAKYGDSSTGVINDIDPEFMKQGEQETRFTSQEVPAEDAKPARTLNPETLKYEEV